MSRLRDFTASLQRFATVLVLSPTCSPLLERLFHLLQLLLILDVAANGFWGSCHQKVFIDVKVFNPNASSYRGSSLYRRLEKEKWRKYEQHIHDVEMDVLPLWCFQLSGVCLLFVTFFKRLASLLADKKDVSYSVVMSWLCYHVSFSLLHSTMTACEGLGHLKVIQPTYKPLIWLYQRDSCP